MMSSVPQFVDVEDKVAGPLTWKQLLWLMAMGAVLLIIFLMFDTGAGIVLSLPVIVLFLALAFYKPNGFPMSMFISQAVLFMFRPKVAVWERPASPMISVKPKEEPKKEISSSENMAKDLNREKLRELARIMDSQGRSGS
jgi:hypothetical protein